MNNVSLVGRLTREPEIKYSGEMAVAKFSLAIDDGYGEKKRTNFPSVVAFGKTAEFIEKYVKKGGLVAVIGKIQTGNYEKSDGTKVYTTDVVADRVQSLEKSEKSQSKIEAPEGFTALDEDRPF